MKILMLITMFFIIGALFIISENSLNLNKIEKRGEFFTGYVSWLNSTFSNVQEVTGNVVRLNWLPE